jgi:hypothetical protein
VGIGEVANPAGRVRHGLGQLRLGLRHQRDPLHGAGRHLVKRIEPSLLDVGRCRDPDGGKLSPTDNPPDSPTLTRQGRRHCAATCVGLELGHPRSSDLTLLRPASRASRNSEGDTDDRKAAGQSHKSMSVIAPASGDTTTNFDRSE